MTLYLLHKPLNLAGFLKQFDHRHTLSVFSPLSLACLHNIFKNKTTKTRIPRYKNTPVLPTNMTAEPLRMGPLLVLLLTSYPSYDTSYKLVPDLPGNMPVEPLKIGPLLVLLLTSLPLMKKATNWFQTYQATCQ